MITVHHFVFGPFEENTYLLYDQTKQCVIIDPGCYDDNERKQLAEFIEKEKLIPTLLINTHCHLDHIFGNGFVADKYNLQLGFHLLDKRIFDAYLATADLYNLKAQPSPEPNYYIEEGQQIKFGNSLLDVVFTPGHSPGSISFVNHQQKFVIAGDVLFNGSIGRTDLPGGNFNTLINSIKEKLFALNDDFTVYSGHGPTTTIAHEKKHNPFLT
jgi:hydroxyacylglutathione hydrolase